MIALRVIMAIWIILCTAAACNPKQLDLAEKTARDFETAVTAATPAATALGGPSAGAVAGSLALVLGAVAGTLAAIRKRRQKATPTKVKTSPSRKR